MRTLTLHCLYTFSCYHYIVVISLLHCENNGCFLKISGKSIKHGTSCQLVAQCACAQFTYAFPAKWCHRVRVHRFAMHKCAQSARVSSQTSSKKKKKKIGPDQSIYGHCDNKCMVSIHSKFTQDHPDVCLALCLDPADLSLLLMHYWCSTAFQSFSSC